MTAWSRYGGTIFVKSQNVETYVQIISVIGTGKYFARCNVVVSDLPDIIRIESILAHAVRSIVPRNSVIVLVARR